MCIRQLWIVTVKMVMKVPNNSGVALISMPLSSGAI